ncbi:MAG: aldo/keto reductase [Eggerthellaceae bacterium]|nr:aldo/keto reductase [Eggerthellaceae bacterium]
MQFRTDPKSGNRLSVLGFGCMRFPRTLGMTDQAKTEQLIAKAVEAGINYFDTAHIYPGSEETLGSILEKHGLRDRVFIATKLPLMRCRAYEDFDVLLAGQLKKLRTDHIDYYLMHNLSDTALWQRLCDLGVERWIAEKKAEGTIRQLGFSFHGKAEEFLALLDAYSWDFCQIQYNYMNINYQAGREGMLKAHGMGLPVIVMEPLLGGRLAADLPPAAQNLFTQADPSRTPVDWALRWLWDQEAVTVVLSGMNEEAQLDENLRIADASRQGMLSEAEHQVYDGVIDALNDAYKVACTGCNYCMPCPNNVNIPGSFTAYNMSYTVGRLSAIQLYAMGISAFSPDNNYSPRQCVDCGLCEKKCPQHIAIPAELKNVLKQMEPWWLRVAMGAMRLQRTKK